MLNQFEVLSIKKINFTVAELSHPMSINGYLKLVCLNQRAIDLGHKACQGCQLDLLYSLVP